MPPVLDLSKIYTFFDTETSDMPKFKLPNSDPSQPWIVQYGALTTDANGVPLHRFCTLCHSHGKPMGAGAEAVHGISKATADMVGIQEGAAFGMLLNLFDAATHLIAHNKAFDLRMLKIMGARIHQDAEKDLEALVNSKPHICTMITTTDLCKLPYPSGRRGYKWPKLEELYFYLFNEPLEGAHDALADVEATAKCFFELKKRGFYAEDV